MTSLKCPLCEKPFDDLSDVANKINWCIHIEQNHEAKRIQTLVLLQLMQITEALQSRLE